MSIKNLFNKGDGKIISSKTLNGVLDDGMESASYVTEFERDAERFMPAVDFSKPQYFARYGSAEEYYKDTISNIYKTFPYDGSLKEKISWHNTGSYLQRFIFEKEYPRTNGFATFNSASHTYTSTKFSDTDWPVYSSSAPQYILFYGGPHADPNGDYKSPLATGPAGKGKSKANIYHTGSLRGSNLEFNMSRGITVEFWMKKNDWSGASKIEYLYDMGSIGATGAQYGHFALYSANDATVKSQIRIWASSGSVANRWDHETGLSDIADGQWHHYALTFGVESDSNITKLYVDGKEQSSLSAPSYDGDGVSGYVGSIEGNMVAALGAQASPQAGDITTPSEDSNLTSGDKGWGNVAYTSFDEFRYWKRIRTAKQIGRFWKFQVGGGTNTDTSNVDLGVYYKFNEGITGDSAKDSIALDYSGRISNGAWEGYQSDSRSTESAIVQSGHVESEYKDPIIYSTHPDVKAYYDRKAQEGLEWDVKNNSSIFHSLPSWIIESDTESSKGGSAVLKKLTQIMASYFDTLQIQIDELPKLKNITYPSSSAGAVVYDKPIAFTDKLLQSYGFDTSDLLTDLSTLERYYNRNESASFGMKIEEIKNLIYQNIYNGLVPTYKSKGTERSLRNVLRSFGVDDELIKINLYADNATYRFEDNYRVNTFDNKYVDFNDYVHRTPLGQAPFQGTVYQNTDAVNEDSVNYISGTNIFNGEHLDGFSFSAEAEAIFPKKVATNKTLGAAPILGSSSIFGMHQLDPNNASTIKWMNGADASNDHAHFKVYSVQSTVNDTDARFAVNLSGSITLSSEYYPEVYDNSKWNFAVSVSPEKKYIDLVSGSSGSIDASTGYKLEFYGVNRELGHIVNEFHVTKSLSYDGGRKFVSAPKRIYAGAHRTDFTGSVVTLSDVKIGSVRAWLDYLPTASVKAHALDPKNFGRSHDYGNSYFSQHQLSGAHIRPIETLILNWDFENVSSSAADGTFYVSDFSSGSSNYLSRYPSLFADIVDKYHDAKGQFFATSSNKIVDKFYVAAGKKQLPELINSDDMINIVEQDDDVFTRETKPIQYYIALEKSMYQTISEEMISFFDTVEYFNNVIGDPINKYRQDYKEMGKLRQLFFERVQNTPDIEKYLSYYKWFDSAIIRMIQGLLPASANASDSMRNMIESHVLERNKYWNKFPTLEMNQPPPEAKIMGINELLYNWKFGHASASDDPSKSSHTEQNKNCLWWNERADRDLSALSSGDATLDSQRNTINYIVTTENSASGPRRKGSDGTTYKGSTYALRRLSRPYKFDIEKSKHLDGGSNEGMNKLHGYHRHAIRWADPLSYITFEKNTTQPPVCDENRSLSIKSKILGKAQVYSNGVPIESSSYNIYGNMKPGLIAPFSIYSASIDKPSYATFVSASRITVTNLHEDKYIIGNEIPMQGPFTEKYVGGQQHRHIDINYSSSIRGSDTEATRPEAWYLQAPVGGKQGEYLINDNFDQWENSTQFNQANNTLGDLGFDNRPQTDSALKYIDIGDKVPSFGFGLHTGTGMGAIAKSYGKLLLPRSGDRMLLTPISKGAALNFAKKTGNPLSPADDLINGGQYEFSKVREFSFFTPQIDLSDVDPISAPPEFKFYYQLRGTNPGTLRVQYASGKEITSTFTDFTVNWDGTDATSITGDQGHHLTGKFGGLWKLAKIDLSSLIGTKFFIRIVNHGHTSFGGNGFAAIDDISLPVDLLDSARMTLYDINYKKVTKQDTDSSLRFDLHRPRAPYYRDEYAKRPVNIRNIKHTASAPAGGAVGRFRGETLIEEQKGHQKLPTIIGNYEHNYQVVQTSGRNVNNMWFRSGSKGAGGVEDSLSNLDAVYGLQDYKLVDRGKLADGTRNKTVIAERFSAPGDVATLSRGFLDRASETFSVYNALPWRNWGTRRFLANIGTSSLLVRHSEKFGLRDGAEQKSVGAPNGDGLKLYGDVDVFLTASYHKIHRNTSYRPAPAGPNYVTVPGSKGFDFGSQTDNSVIVEAEDHDDLSFNNGTPGQDDSFSLSMWIKRKDVTATNTKEWLAGKSGEYAVYLYTTGSEGTAVSADKDDRFLVFQLGSAEPGTCLDGTCAADANATGHKLFYDISSGFNGKHDVWDNVVCTYNGASAAGKTNMSIYVNGELKTSNGTTDFGTSGSPGYTGMSNTSNKFTIGARAAVTDSCDATIDEVSLWDATLAADKVTEIYNGGKSTNLNEHSSVSNLVAWWAMGDVNDKCGSDYTDYVNSTYAEGSVTISGDSWPTEVIGNAASKDFFVPEPTEPLSDFWSALDGEYFQLEDYEGTPAKFLFSHTSAAPSAASTNSTLLIPAVTSAGGNFNALSLVNTPQFEKFWIKDTEGNRVLFYFVKDLVVSTDELTFNNTTVITADVTTGYKAEVSMGMGTFQQIDDGLITPKLIAATISNAVTQAKAAGVLKVTAGSYSAVGGTSATDNPWSVNLVQDVSGEAGNGTIGLHNEALSSVLKKSGGWNWGASPPTFSGGNDGALTYAAGPPKTITIKVGDNPATKAAISNRIYEAFVLAKQNGWKITATEPTTNTLNNAATGLVTIVSPITLTQDAEGAAGNKTISFLGVDITNQSWGKESSQSYPWSFSDGATGILPQSVLDSQTITLTDASGNSLKIAFDSTQSLGNNVLNTDVSPPVLTIATKDLSNPYSIAVETVLVADSATVSIALAADNPAIAFGAISPGSSAADGSNQTITLTQEVGGSTGNKSITTVGDHITAVDFTGGPVATGEGIIEDQKGSHDAVILGDSSIDYFVDGTPNYLDYSVDINWQGNDTILKSVHDNWLVQRPIPQSDVQYNWIWRSLDQKQEPFSHLYASSSEAYNSQNPTAPWGYATASHQFRFVSSSDMGSHRDKVSAFYVINQPPGALDGFNVEYFVENWKYGVSRAYVTSPGFMPNDMVGMNTNIHESFDTGSNTLGYLPTGSKFFEYFKTGLTTLPSIGSHMGALAGGIAGNAEVLNGILLHRNGPYHYPSWKQIRTGEHPIARHQRKNSIITITGEEGVFGDKTPYEWGANPSGPGSIYRAYALIHPHRKVLSSGLIIRRYKEPAVTSKFKPMTATAWQRTGLDTRFVYTYANNMIKFSNQALNERLKIYEVSDFHASSDNDIHQTVIDSELVGAPYRYTESVWPRGSNTYLNETRKRVEYAEIQGHGPKGIDKISHNTFWKGRHTLAFPDRKRNEGYAYNSQGWLLSRFGGPKLDDGTYFMDYGPTDPMPFCDAVSVAAGLGLGTTALSGKACTVVSASENMNFGGTVLPFCNPCIGSTFQDMPLSAWPLDEGKYGGVMEVHSYHPNSLYEGGMYGPTYKQRWGKTDDFRKCLGRESMSTAETLDAAGSSTVFRGTYNLISGSTFGDHFVSGTFGMKGELAEDPSMNFLTSWASAYWACGTASFFYPFVDKTAANQNTQPSSPGDAINAGYEYTAMGGSDYELHREALVNNEDIDAPVWQSPPTFSTMFRGGYRRPYASPCFFRDPYNNFNVIGLSASFSGGPAGKESGSAETLHGRTVVGGKYKISHHGGPTEVQTNILDFSGALGYVKTAPYYRTNKLAGKNPWYDSYESYIDDVRSLGQDYGVLAEFNMSENMDEYAQYNFDWTRPNPGFLTLKGAKLSSSLGYEPFASHDLALADVLESIGADIANPGGMNGTMDRDFLRRYCISDSVRYRNKMAEDFEIPRRIKLRFDAVTKLMPYYGFYPVTRTLQLATLFSQSIGPYLSSSTDTYKINKRTYLGYNSIKQLWNDGDNAVDDNPLGDDIRFSFTDNYTEPGAEFITASQHPTYQLRTGMAAEGQLIDIESDPYWGADPEYPTIDPGASSIALKVKDGAHFSTKLFDLADAGHEGSIGWKKALLDVHRAGKMQAMLQPTFAPGIMYNTIKSGIAVDYPVYINQADVDPTPQTPSEFTTTEGGPVVALRDYTDGVMMQVKPNFRLPFEAIYDLSKIPSSEQVGDLATSMGLTTETYGRGLELSEIPKIYYTEPAWFQCGTDDQGKAKLGKKMAGSFWAAWGGHRGPLYEKAANNFLSEIPNFFLKNKGLTNFKSAPSSKIKNLIEGKTYIMKVTLEIFDEHSHPNSGNAGVNGEFVMAEGPRKPLVPMNDTATQFQPLPRRGSIFGPALPYQDHRDGQQFTGGPTATGPLLTNAGDIKSTGSSGEMYDLRYHEADPGYAPWTPPYYYGKVHKWLAYTHTTPKMVTTEGGYEMGATPTIDEIHSNIINNPLTTEFNDLGRPLYYREDGTPVRARDIMRRDEALTAGDVPYPHASGYWGHLAYENRMKLTASLDIFKKRAVITQVEVPPQRISPGGTDPLLPPQIVNKVDHIWEISTKFECPVINLSGSSYVGSNRHRPDFVPGSNNKDGYFSDRTGRSIWMGYGNTSNVGEAEKTTLPDGTKVSIPKRGIKLSLSDAAFTDDSHNGSLLDALGFRDNNTEPQELSKYIGQIASGKEISEAVVAIPFLEIEIPKVTFRPFSRYNIDDINFIKIHPDEYFAQWQNFHAGAAAVKIHPSDPTAHTKLNLDQPEQAIGKTGITALMDMVSKYIIPPELDFYHKGIGSSEDAKYEITRRRFGNNEHSGLNPFIMYIHEFKRELNSKDLGDIWQNLLPDTGMRGKKEASSVGTDLAGPNSQYELFGRLDDLLDITVLGHNIHGRNKNTRTLKKIFADPSHPGLKWLVFKVKKRANMYMSQVKYPAAPGISPPGGAISDNIWNTKYSYNWPYDFFSLVEVAKLTVEYDYTKSS